MTYITSYRDAYLSSIGLLTCKRCGIGMYNKTTTCDICGYVEIYDKNKDVMLSNDLDNIIEYLTESINDKPLGTLNTKILTHSLLKRLKVTTDANVKIKYEVLQDTANYLRGYLGYYNVPTSVKKQDNVILAEEVLEHCDETVRAYLINLCL